MGLAHVRLIRQIVPQCFGKPHWTKLDSLEGLGLWGNLVIFQVLQEISQSHLKLCLVDVPFLTDKSAINCVTKTCGMHNLMRKYYQSIICLTQHGQLEKSHFTTADSASSFATCPWFLGLPFLCSSWMFVLAGLFFDFVLFSKSL